MDTNKIIELLFYTLPALITGGVAYYFFQMFVQNEDKKRHFLLMRQNQKGSLPLKLQAYERMTLFMERIDPSKLLIRITPVSTDKNDYSNFVIAQVEQEFEHNLTQQIYISDECWAIIQTAKNSTIQMLRKAASNPEVADADKLRELILSTLLDKNTPSSAALSYIRNEVRELI
ncbi:hypothetical protein FNO01nite_12930 [Flavobacterium noncentrifugens]|uniref:Uncharacterized protein n=1 Tax=Flavobacterium noncentrifugens TaxID=1128970 RepID=A0A1G8VT20_9FLAO|nr:hypothetical protein [Flavobacterium noncentrifugens]GEP50621.1 hypothetical protein FNO01nite_12930 [Flavobacterium noncentrifugens]SDJ68605.1 hypothetical protein SAMN04487935_1490 [Flavobacterium noncentrifugens]